jgi:hypothetical protein
VSPRVAETVYGLDTGTADCREQTEAALND